MICESYNKLVPWVLWILCFSLLVFLLNKSCDFTWSTEITSYALWWWESYCVITWMCKTVHRSNYVGSLLALSFDFLVYHWHMTSIKLLYMQSVTKHQCVSPCTMLQNHNIAWRNFSSLFLNIIKRGEGVETENCPNTVFLIIFVTDCLKKIEKLNAVFPVAHFTSNWRYAITHYVTILQLLAAT